MLPFRAWILPVLTLGPLAAWLALCDRVDANGLSFGLLVGVAAVVTALELRWPARREWRLTPREALHDAFWVAGTNFVWGPLAWGLAVKPLRDAVVAWRGDIVAWPTALPLAVKVLLALLLTELVGYAFHRAEHHNPLLWRLHATHHATTRMSWAKATINHPLEQPFLLLLRALPFAFLGVGRMEAVGAGFLYAALNLIAHANLDLPEGPLGRLFTTPGQHLRHHALALGESRSNYGCAVILWDRLFGTYAGDAGPARGAAKLGIEDGRPFRLLGELALPFVRARAPEVAPVRAE